MAEGGSPAPHGDRSAGPVTGGCACGGIRYETRGWLRDVVDCHCERCRRITGHFMAATQSLDADLVVADSGTLRWYEPAVGIYYGFCGRCGSTLFWRAAGAGRTSIAAGTIDPPTGLTTTTAWYTDQASDYHRLDPSLDQHALE